MPSRSGLRRTSSALGLLLPLLAGAQLQRPLPTNSPQTLTVTPRVHVRASETVDVDLLGALARPGVILWLRTSGNTLKASLVERLARFDTVWVQVHAPLKPVDARVWAAVPRAGAWVDVSSLAELKKLPGARRVAVELSGALTDAILEQLRSARVDEVRWAPQGEVDLLRWSQFSQLRGRRVLVAPVGETWPVTCGQRAGPSVEVHLSSLLAASSEVFPCGAGARVVVPMDTDDWLLRSLVLRDPTVELVVDAPDDEHARGARALVERLQLSPDKKR